MSEAIVHIGYNKCGSTAIQAWLAENAAALGGLGFAYRRTDPRPDVVCSNHQFLELGYSLAGIRLDRPAAAEAFGYDRASLESQRGFAARFADDYDGWLARQAGRTVIISNEALGPHLVSGRLIRGLDGWLQARFASVRYLAYIRQPVPWTVSAWLQARRTRPALQPFESFATKGALAPFARTLPAWLKVVGRARLDVRLYHEAWLEGEGLVADFRAALGLPQGVTLGPARQLNTSRTPTGRRRSGVLRQLLRRPTPPLPRPDPAPELRALIHERHAEAMDWIGTTFFADRLSRYRDWLAGDTAPSFKEA